MLNFRSLLTLEFFNFRLKIAPFKSQNYQSVAAAPTRVVFSEMHPIEIFRQLFLFKIVQRSYNKDFEVVTKFHGLRARAVSYAPKIFKVLLKRMVA